MFIGIEVRHDISRLQGLSGAILPQHFNVGFCLSDCEYLYVDCSRRIIVFSMPSWLLVKSRTKNVDERSAGKPCCIL